MFKVIIISGESVMDATFEFLYAARKFAYENGGRVFIKNKMLYDYSAK